MTIVDCTIGPGGHSEEILKRINPGGRLIGIDRDREALDIARHRLKHFEESVVLVHESFENLRMVFERIGIGEADGFLFDLGVSSLQLDKPERGFSFRYDTALDMRMDRETGVTAADIVNKSSEDELVWILENYGEERFSRKITQSIVRERKLSPIETTGMLVEIILKAVPYKGRHGRVHPATRTFQALRISVNRELSVLGKALEEAVGLLKAGGIICVISYHSLEDRIVKNKFKEAKSNGILELVYKKPLVPQRQEIGGNPRSRSAKLRIAKRMDIKI